MVPRFACALCALSALAWPWGSRSAKYQLPRPVPSLRVLASDRLVRRVDAGPEHTRSRDRVCIAHKPAQREKGLLF